MEQKIKQLKSKKHFCRRICIYVHVCQKKIVTIFIQTLIG